MKPYIVAFIGNKRVGTEGKVLKTLVSALEEQIVENVYRVRKLPVTFYCGGYGEFSYLAAKAIDILRERYPEFEAEKIFVTPYIAPSYSQTLDYMKEFYDGIVYPPLESVPAKFAIFRRNQWMIDECDLLVTYVRDKTGNTRKFVEYAIRKKKEILYVEEDGADFEPLSMQRRRWKKK